MSRRTPLLAVVLSAFALAACDAANRETLPGASGNPDLGVRVGPGLTCTPCLQASDCGGAACAQYAGDDYCATPCTSNADCQTDEACTLMTSLNGSESQGCVPRSGTCGGGGGCPACTTGTTCDPSSGTCVAGGGVDMATPMGGGQTCGSYVGPSTTACCTSCKQGAANCQANGCYGGWWCDTSACRCHAPPANCGGGGGGPVDMAMGGPIDAGPIPVGSIGPNGGSVSRLFFAVIGDTRPGNIDDTANYPTAIITKIYGDLAAMAPRPQFVVTTGDYMFASPSGGEAAKQMPLYIGAQKQYTSLGNPVFAAMGNHECTGATASNCAAQTTNNYTVYMDNLVKPLGKTTPYYSVSFTDTNNQWTAKLLVAACNAWDQTQATWLQTQLATPTTYTFVARHEPSSTNNAPCVSQMDGLLAKAKYDLLIVGHTHTFSHSGSQVIVGNGGAPLSGGGDYGYATIEQQQGGGFTVTQYDYQTAMPVSTFTVP